MNVEIAERLAARRKLAGLSQEALAEKLGVSRQAVSKWERSESSPDTDNLIALAKLYGVSLDELLYVDESIEDDVAFAPENLGVPPQEIRARVDAALKQVGMYDFRLHAPHLLSGGQKQRLSVARALVRKPQILVLDDSSSALDYATEAAMRKAILALPYKPTLFIVSQRASSVMCADRILVLEDGRLVGDGNHKALLANCPAYCEIYHSQFSEEVTDA